MYMYEYEIVGKRSISGVSLLGLNQVQICFSSFFPTCLPNKIRYFQNWLLVHYLDIRERNQQFARILEIINIFMPCQFMIPW